MPSLRLFILWIVFVCVPLQGYAASAMALCDAVHAMHGMVAADGGGEGTRRFDRVRESHGSHADDHGTHPGHDAHASHDAHAGHDARADAPADGTHDGMAVDASHACGTCAACHASALTGGFDVAVLHELPPADLAEPALAPTTRVPRVLDKPPRA
jgi:hypothetical protein